MTISPDFSELVDERVKVAAVINGYGPEATVTTQYDQAGLLDAFGRFRVSMPYTVFDSKQVYDDALIANNAENFPHLFDNAQLSGAGTATAFNINTASTTLSVTAMTAGRRVRQTRRRLNYQPGKSQRVLLTGVIGTAGAGLTKRFGLFDDNNGLFFEVTGGVLYVVQRSYVSGVPVDTRVPQSSWNIDPLDGTGTSRDVLDLTKANIFYIHFEWLGVGSTRFGVVIDGLLHYAHQFNNANALSTVYMSTSNLPVRVEIVNDGTGDASAITMICVSVDSEGGVQINGRNRSVEAGVTPIVLANAGTEYAILGIRLRSTHLGVQIDPTFLDAVITTPADVGRYRLHINPTVTGTFTYADLPNTAVQAAIGSAAPTITGDGYIISSGYIKTDRAASIPERLNEKLGSSIAGVADTLVLGITPITSGISVLCSLDWREL